MGYSGRYHAASLAAVFVALAIGILIGVGLGHKVVSGTTKNLAQMWRNTAIAAAATFVGIAAAFLGARE